MHFLIVSCIVFLAVCESSSQEVGRQKRFLWTQLGGVISPPFQQFQYNPYSDCPTTDGNRTGICVASAYECRSGNGRILGNCYAPSQTGQQGQSGSFGSGQIGSGQNFGNNIYGGRIVGVCCFYQVTCGGKALYNGTYFRNLNAPAAYTETRSCSIEVPRLRRDICQLRIDFLQFSLYPPESGNCNKDRFVVSGQAENSILTPLCGYNTGQHMYVELSSAHGPVTLNVLTMGNWNRNFDIRITQIQCTSPYRAPANCLQYHYTIMGQIKSFNFLEYSSSSFYLNNLDYTICFKKDNGFCTMTYYLPTSFTQSNQQGNQNIPNRPTTDLSTFFSIVPEQSVTKDTAGQGPKECTTDYLILSNLRLCGYRLNGDVFSAATSTNSDVSDNTTRPIFARFVSNDAATDKGFYINYRLNPCFIGGR